ncbi:MAG: HU family DNA-binding protein [Muribaculaceae bacterium]|nr:HU family DNA-binding protein [Muribaculaceae bacterium]
MDHKTLLDKISSDSGIDGDEIQRIVSALCFTIGECCVERDAVVIPGFGQFEARKRMERIVIHPSTGERLLVPPKLVLNFRPSGVLKSKIEPLDNEVV